VVKEDEVSLKWVFSGVARATVSLGRPWFTLTENDVIF
jgi:hypothetical protein